MDSKHMKLLVLEDQLVYVHLLGVLPVRPDMAPFELVHVRSLHEWLDRLPDEEFDLILLDLDMADSSGYATFRQARDQAPFTPIIVLTAAHNEEWGRQLIREGAQDCLIKGETDANLLDRSIRYAIERHKMQMALRSLTLTDELTGLYNRRGFMTLADHHWRLARRTQRPFGIIYADLDGFKRINDSYGHAEGDRALINTSQILAETFRDSDIVARFGGDEFIVLVADVDENGLNMITGRLQVAFLDYARDHQLKYGFSLSIGVAHFDPASDTGLEQLVRQADEALYAAKRR